MEKQNKWWQHPKSKKTGKMGLVLAVLGLILWGVFFYPYVSTEDARVAMTLARIAPANVNGRIEKVLVEEGSVVKKGDVLVEIDRRIPAANYDRAQEKKELASRELARMKRLVEQGSVTKQAFEQANAEFYNAEAEFKHAEVVLENTILKSPFDGVVIQKNAEVGNILEQNQVAAVVADEANAWIAANIEENSVGALKVGQPVFISVDAGGKLEGELIEIRNAVAAQFALIPSDSGAGNFTKVVQRVPVKIKITKRNGLQLRAGQSVEIKIRVH